MNRYIISFLLCLFFFIGMESCADGSSKQLKQYVDSFSVAYFNWRFVEAQAYTTKESHLWLKYAASQVSQQDIDSLRSMKEGATVKIEDIKYIDDSTAEAKVSIKNYMAMDSIEGKHHIVGESLFTLPLVYKNDKWLVKLAALPR